MDEPAPLTVHGLGGNPNPYAYVGGAVFDGVDPFGLDAQLVSRDRTAGNDDWGDTYEVSASAVSASPTASAPDSLAEHAGAAVAEAAGAAARSFQRTYEQSKLKDRVGWVRTTYDASQLKDSVDNPTHIPDNSRRGIDALLKIEAILSIGVGALPPAGPAPALVGGGSAVAPARAAVVPLAVGALQATQKGDQSKPASANKPNFQPNPAHTPGQPGFNPRKTPEPADSAAVFQDAIQGKDDNWYGKGGNGQLYRYFDDNAGGAHFSGMTGDDGIPLDRIPIGVRRFFGMVR